MRIQGEDEILSDFYQSFNSRNMVLFVGEGATSNELPKELCDLPWSCIVTTKKEESFRNLFTSDNRRVHEYCTKRSLPSKIFDRDNLPIIRMYGLEENILLDEEEEELENARIEEESTKFMSTIMMKLDVLSRMIVVGYNPDNSKDYKRLKFVVSWRDCAGGDLYFFGIDQSSDERAKLVKSIDKYNYYYSEDSLASIIGKQEELLVDSFSEYSQREDSDSLFYKGNKPAYISNAMLLRYRDIGELLTEEKIYEVRPMGRIQQSRWFFNFLTRSASEGPQWYGYLKNSEFYLKRGFEDTLAVLVRNVLAGKEMAKGYSVPIILEGDPGSSKTITLGALAYRIYNEHINPVVYIHKNQLNTNTDVDELDRMLKEIEDSGERDMRILVIWDGSAYRNVAENAAVICRKLDNRGRRFTFVCSSYRKLNTMSSDKKEGLYYRASGSGDIDQVSRNDKYNIAFEDNCYYIHSYREMTTREMVDLFNKARLYLKQDYTNITQKWQLLQNEGNSSIFDYLYKLIILLQPPLEIGLGEEQTKVYSFVQEELENIANGSDNGEKESFVSPMMRALIDAGLDPSLLADEEKEESEIQNGNYDLKQFNTCIAMFSRFKLETPVSLALNVLYTGEEEGEVHFYSNRNRDLFNKITTSIPWILYRQNDEGEFVFFYRSSLEAEIYLKNNPLEADMQIAMICKMIDFYVKNYRELHSTDIEVKNAIQRLLRLIGPNSEYIPFQTENSEHTGVLSHLDELISKLQWMREVEKVPDEDESFATIEITFLREYYGSLWGKLRNATEIKEVWKYYPDIYTPESYLDRIMHLQKAVTLANACIDRLEHTNVDRSLRRYIASQINSLTVEECRCHMKQEELCREYEAMCKENSIIISDAYKSVLYPYLPQYRMLVKALNSDPTNGYIYNALFSLFENEYDKSTSEEQRLELLSGIRMIADDASTIDIHNRGAVGQDELGDHIAQIMAYSGKTRVNIESLQDKTCSEAFQNLYVQMLKQGNASAIIFVCQQELDNIGLGKLNCVFGGVQDNSEYVLSEYQVTKCKEIREFMTLPENMECIINDSHALYMLLRITWMSYNKRALMDGRRECRLTYLNKNQWSDIVSICQKYERVTSVNKKPIVILIHALGVLQLTNNYKEAYSLLNDLKEDAFFATPRMRVPYMYCNENGEPHLYSGIVLSVDDKGSKGYIRVDGIPKFLGFGIDEGVRFYSKNLGFGFKLEANEALNGLELGIGYMGYSLYTKGGRSHLEGR